MQVGHDQENLFNLCLALKIHSSKPLSESNDGVVPWHNCPALKGKAATQVGLAGTGKETIGEWES